MRAFFFLHYPVGGVSVYVVLGSSPSSSNTNFPFLFLHVVFLSWHGVWTYVCRDLFDVAVALTLLGGLYFLGSWNYTKSVAVDIVSSEVGRDAISDLRQGSRSATEDANRAGPILPIDSCLCSKAVAILCGDPSHGFRLLHHPQCPLPSAETCLILTHVIKYGRAADNTSTKSLGFPSSPIDAHLAGTLYQTISTGSLSLTAPRAHHGVSIQRYLHPVRRPCL